MLPVLLLSIAACTLDARTIPGEPETIWTVAALRAASASGWATVEEVRVTSDRTLPGTAFYVQDPGGGPGTGMRVELGGILFDWPPPLGTPVRLSGWVSQRDEGPVMTLEEIDDAEVLGPPAALVATAWADGPLGYDLAVVHDLTLTSAPDPAGFADTDGPVRLGGTFGATPGYGTSGAATGILESDALSLRDAADWTGAWEGAPAVETTLAAIRAGVHPDGAPVILEDMLLATQWSRGGQLAVIQEATGRGIWVDAEGWGVAGELGEVGRWTGEVRSDGEGLRLRVWTDPVVAGSAAPVLGDLIDGDLVELTVTGLDGPDALGDWTTEEGLVLDDRFVALDALADPAIVRGAVRMVDDLHRVAVTEVLDPP